MMLSPIIPPVPGLDQLTALLDLIRSPDEYQRKVKELVATKAEVEKAHSALSEAQSELNDRSRELHEREAKVAEDARMAQQGQIAVSVERSNFATEQARHLKELSEGKDSLAKAKVKVDKFHNDLVEREAKVAEGEAALEKAQEEYQARIVALVSREERMRQAEADLSKRQSYLSTLLAEIKSKL